MDRLLEERIAEHELAVAFARQLMADLGEKPALRIIGRAVMKLEAEGGRKLAVTLGDDSLAAFGQHFCRQQRKGTLTLLEATPERLEVRITRCPSTEALRLLDMPALAPLFCASTHAITRGFSPRLRAHHTQSIGTGGAYCDWIWTYAEDAEPEPAESPAPAEPVSGGMQMDARLQDRVNRYEMAVAFAKQFIEELGEAPAMEIIGRAFEQIQLQNAERLQAQLGGNSFEALAEHMSRQAETLDGMEVLEITDRQIATKITRCVAWEAFDQLGAPQLCRPYCASDYGYIKAFNPQMKLIRTKTIADGDAYCDHIWALEDDACTGQP